MPELPLETSRQSGSVTERWVLFPRFSPRKSTVGLPGSTGPCRSCFSSSSELRRRFLYSSGSMATSIGTKLLKLAFVRTRVPSALTCPLMSFSCIARFTVWSNNRSNTPDRSKRRRRFWLKVEASHGCSSSPRPTNHRSAMLHCSSMTSFRLLVIPSKYPPTKARNSCSGGIHGRPTAEYSARHSRRMACLSISGRIARSG